MKINLEYPRPLWTDRDPEIFDSITVFALSFPTTLYYFKNHDTGAEEVLFTVLGFGIRVNRLIDPKGDRDE